MYIFLYNPLLNSVAQLLRISKFHRDKIFSSGTWATFAPLLWMIDAQSRSIHPASPFVPTVQNNLLLNLNRLYFMKLITLVSPFFYVYVHSYPPLYTSDHTEVSFCSKFKLFCTSLHENYIIDRPPSLLPSSCIASHGSATSCKSQC